MSNDLKTNLVELYGTNKRQITVQDFDFNSSSKNELLFFFKPECFLVESKASLNAIIDMVLRKFEEFNVRVAGSLALNGSRLEELQAMDRHYGFINRVSKGASMLLTEEERTEMRQTLGLEDFPNDLFLGGHEFLRRFPNHDADSLDEIWETKNSHRLKSGFYYQLYHIDENDVILVNGFHPQQLNHYTTAAHQTVLLLLHSDTDWKPLRENLIGDTYPENADPNSIRGELFRNRQKYGLKRVTIFDNCVHMSAGPFEAMFELNNFLSGMKESQFDLLHTNMGQELTRLGLGDKCEFALSNPEAEINSRTQKLFDYTEGLNTDEAASIFATHFQTSEK